MRVTFIGHASVLLSFNSTHFIFDPVFNDRIVFLRRHIPPGLPLEALPPLSGIFISHGHYDHFDRWTLKRLSRSIPVVAARGLGIHLQKLGFQDIRELSPWQTTQLDSFKITATPAKHSGKQPFFHEVSEFVGFVIENEKTAYFAGDTAYFDGFKEIGQRFKIDVALLPIGAYKPRKNLKKHMNPPDALRAFKDLGARWMIPIHWGTFHLGWEGINAPARWLARILEKEPQPVKILKAGEWAEF